MKIGVLYIALGSYSVMWDEFYFSAKKHFFKNEIKHFFVFTDDQKIKNNSDITVIPTKNMGWPGNTLYRFQMFTSIKEQLKAFDYLYFFNANALFVKDVDVDILPKTKDAFVSVQHFAYINQHPSKIGYDRNKKSTAYVPWKHEPKIYCQACLIGAASGPFLEMSKVLSENIRKDDENGVCARWHDESHFNHYLMTHEINALPTTYAYPELKLDNTKESLPGISILMRSKERYGNLSVLRYGKKRSLWKTLCFKTKNQMVKINCLFHRCFWRFYK